MAYMNVLQAELRERLHSSEFDRIMETTTV
jgi:hypothetical protein